MSRALTDAQKNLLDDYDPALRRAGLKTTLDEVLRDKAEASWQKAADDGNAADTLAESLIFKNTSGRARTVTKVEVLSGATGLTAHASNYATVTIRTRDAAGANGAVIVAATTEVVGTGDWVTLIPLDFGTLASVALPIGFSLTITITKAASGVVVPASVFLVSLD